MSSLSRPLVVAVLGPTGVGKTEVATRLARRLGAEVVVADSRQVYRGLDIATNKPSPEQRRGVRFHLLDLVEPTQAFNVHQYLERASQAVREIAGRGRAVVLEGGTALYVDALLDGFSLAGVAPSPQRRAELEGLTTEDLAQLVGRLDPGAEVDRKNRVRLVRAVEILERAGPPLAARRLSRPPQWRVIRVGLRLDREELARRLALRVAEQLARGLIEETVAALGAGVAPGAPALTGIGYRQVVAHLAGELRREQLVAAMEAANRSYARRQLSWLRRDRRIRWFEASPDPLSAILSHVKEEAAF